MSAAGDASARETGWPSGQPATRAMIDVMRERFRQIAEEGFTTGHDDGHADGTLALAGACYAACLNPSDWSSPVAIVTTNLSPEEADYNRGRFWGFLRWPWEPQWWKPKSRRQNLVRAAALIVAEIERIDRAWDT